MVSMHRDVGEAKEVAQPKSSIISWQEKKTEVSDSLPQKPQNWATY